MLRRQGRYLLGLRPTGKRHGGRWEFPGGKLEDGESLLAAARRELAEELELEVARVGRVLHAIADGASPFVIEFVETWAEGEPAALEHDRVGWFSLEEMGVMRLAPADAAFVAWLARDSAGRG